MSDENFKFDLPIAATPSEISESFSLQEEQINNTAISDPLKAAQLEQAITDKQKRLELRASERSRSIGEHTQDASGTLLKGAIDLGGIAYAGADVASRALGTVGKVLTGSDQEPVSLDELTEKAYNKLGIESAFSEKLSEARNIVDDNFVSRPLAAAKERVNELTASRESGSADRVELMIEKGYNDTLAKVIDEVGSFGTSVVDNISEPIVAIDAALQSLPQLFLGGAAGKAAINHSLKGMTTQQAKKHLASKAGKAAATKAATKAGVATTALSEGLSNGIQAKADVLSTPHESLLESSPLYAQLINDGVDKVKAAQTVSNKVFDVVTAISGTVGAISSKITGAAKFEGNLFNPEGTVKNIVMKTIGAGASEGVEETVQGAAGQLATNIGKKTYSDKDQKIESGVGTAAGQGLVTGALSGGGAKAATESVAAVAKKVKESTQGVVEATEQTEAVKTILSTPEAVTKSRNTKDTDYNPQTAFEVASDNSQIPTEPTAVVKHVAELQTHVNNMEAEHIDGLTEALELPTGTQEEKDIQSAKLTQLKTKAAAIVSAQEVVDGMKTTSTVAPKDAQVKVDSIVNSTDVKSEQTQADVFEILGSTPTLSKPQLESLVKSDALTTEQKTRVNNRIKTVDAIAQVEANSTGSVNNEVLYGGGGKKGIQQHQAVIDTQLKGGSKTDANKALVAFHKFATSHATKVKAVVEAFKAVTKDKDSPLAQELVSKVAAEYKTKNGKPLEIHINSNKDGFVSTLIDEGNALKAAFAESKALFVGTSVPAQANTNINTPKTAEAVPQAKAPKETVAPVVKAETSADALPTKNSENEGAQLLKIITDAGGTVKAAIRNNTENKKALKALRQQAADIVVKAPVVAPVVEPQVKTTTEVSEPTNSIHSSVARSPELSSKFSPSKKVSKSLLHTVPKFFESLKKTTFTRETITEQQDKALDGIRIFNANFVKQLRTKTIDAVKFNKASDAGKAAIIKRNLAQGLVNEDGQMDDNVESTIAMVVYNWLTTRAVKTLYNTDEDINSILDADDDTAVGLDARNLLSKVGSVRTIIAEALGREIVKLLGIEPNKDTSAVEQSKLEMSLGLIALRNLESLGLVTDTPVDMGDIAQLKQTLTTIPELNSYSKNEFSDLRKAIVQLGGSYKNKDDIHTLRKQYVALYSSPVHFIRVAAVEDTDSKFTNQRIHPLVSSMIDNVKNSDGVMDTLFGIESHNTGALFNKPTEAPTKIKGTTQTVPAKVQEILLKHSQRPHQNKMNVAQPFMFLSHDNQMLISGATENVETTVHKSNRESVEAVNASIERQITDFNNHVAETQNKGGLDTPFYFAHEVWKNMRAGMVGNTINLQSSKIHRHLIGMSNWEVEIDPNNPEQFSNFMVGVAESIGIKVDKTMTDESIKQALNKLQSPVMQAGIAAIKLVNSGVDIDNQEQVEADIVAAVKEGGEKLYTLDGLVAYSQMDGDKPFKSNLFREVDGVTNGVIIGLFQLAAQGDYQELLKQLARGGMFSDDTQDWAEWYSRQGNNDSYQDMALSWVNYKNSIEYAVNNGTKLDSKKADRAVRVLRNMGAMVIPAMDALVGSFTEAENNDIVSKIGRDLAKNPLMITNYGAALKKVLEEFSDKVLTDTMGKVAKAVVNQDVAELARISGFLSTITNTNVVFNIETGLDTVLTPQQVQTFKDAITAYYGTSLEAAIKEKFGTFIDNRTQLNNALKVSFEAFNIVFTRQVADEEAKLGHDLSKERRLEIVKELQDMVPSFKSPMSNGLDDSIVVMKEEKERQTTSEYRVEVQFKEGKNTNAYINKKKYVDGGVSGTILGIHSIDAATMYGLLEQYAALNVHDAAAFSLLDTLEGTEALNKSFYDVMSQYNLREEIQESMLRAVAILRDGDNGRLDLLTLNTVLTDSKLLQEGETIDQWTSKFMNQTVADNKIRKQVLEKLTHIAQYNPGQGARYTVPKKVDDTSKATEKQEQTIIEEELATEFKAIRESTETKAPSSADVKVSVDMVLQRLRILKGDKSMPSNSVGILSQVARLVQKGMSYTAAFKVLNAANGDYYTNNEQAIEDDTNEGKLAFDKFTLIAESLETLEQELTTMFSQEPTAFQETLFSSPDAIDPNNFNAVSTQTVNNMSSEAVFVSLDTVGNVRETTEHKAHLGELLKTTINSVMKPFQLKLRQSGNKTYGATTGNNVFISTGQGTLSNGTQMSAQETYVHELMHNITQAGIDGASWARQELLQLFNVAEKHIKPEDFLNSDAAGNILDYAGNIITPQSASYSQELDAATERYDYIFNNKDSSASNKNAYLHEFMALGTTNASFMKALSNIDGATVRTGYWLGSVPATLVGLFQRLADWLSGKITGSADVTADKKLMILAEQLASVDSRKKNVIYRGMVDTNDIVQSAVAKFIAEPILKLANSDLVQKSKINTVKSIGSIVKRIPTTTIAAYSTTMGKVARRMGIGHENIVSSLTTEIRGNTSEVNVWHKLLRQSKKTIDQARLHIKTGVSKQVNSAFLTTLSTLDKVAINKLVLKTDLSSVMDLYSTNELANFMSDDVLLNSEIRKLETQFSLYGNSNHYYRKLTKSLGNYMATGRFTEHQSLLNAHNIANHYGTDVAPTGDIEAATELIDTLATLHAISASNVDTRTRMAEIIKRENKVDNVNNGVTFLMQVQADSKSRSLDKLFNGQKALMVKGYTKEIFNPYISYVVASANEERTLAREGYYREKNPLVRDKDDPNREIMYRYVSKDGLVTSYMAGIASFTNRVVKGTDLLKSYTQGTNNDPALEAKIDNVNLDKVKKQQARQLFSKQDTSINEATLVPVLDGSGNVVGYRHMMDEITKDRLLEKDNAFDNVIGATEASINDKVATEVINSKLVSTAKDEYDAGYTSNPEDFVFIGRTSNIERYKEIYQLLPKTMRQEIKNTWGTDGMYVRGEMVTLLFGQRKASLAGKLQATESFQKLNDTVLNMFNFSLGRGIQNFENVWQELVKTVKDVIVIKSGVVLAGNVGSNLILLKTLGVSTSDIIKHHSVAIRAAKSYQSNLAELEALEREVRVNSNTPDINKKKVKIARLKSELSTNPVKELIDEGVYQSIVEDVDALDDQYTYKTKLQEWITPSFVSDGGVPTVLKDIGNNLIVSHETDVYKALREATQLSDFVARYTLHKHNMDNGMTKDASIIKIVDTFINYDLPTHKGIQYANDIGLVMFTKFFIRTQKVIFSMLRDHPANVLVGLGLQGVLGDFSDISDSIFTPESVMNKFNTPLDVATSLVDIPMVNLATGG